MFPEIIKVICYLFFQFCRNIFAFSKWLVTNMFNERKPLIEMFFSFSWLVCFFDSEYNFNEFIHNVCKYNDSNDLNHTSDDFLRITYGVKITISYSWKSCHHKVHSPDQLIYNIHFTAYITFALWFSKTEMNDKCITCTVWEVKG